MEQQVLFKGELMEELVRGYFIGLGYYVARGVKYRYQNSDLTDVDLYLYKRNSSLTRERINVDIKNKKTPQAFERILWANGIMKLLGFDSCVVATKDSRPVIHSFGQKHKTTILDGIFLTKLAQGKPLDRLSEEDFLNTLSSHTSYKKFDNKDWRYAYETSKSRLLNEQDFSGFNSTLSDLVHFIEVATIEDLKRETATRMLYVVLSHLLIIMDFILRDISFLEAREREKRLAEGFTFGNLGKEGVNKIISIAVQISGNKSADSYLNSLRSISIEMLTTYFSKAENANNIFSLAKDFEGLAYKKSFTNPNELDSPAKGVLSLMLDFAEVERKRFFETYSKKPIVVEIKQDVLKVVNATYGTSKKSIDITNEVNQFVKNNRLEFVINNEIGGDPDVGTVKDFRITYEVNGFRRTKHFKEGEQVVITSILE